MPEQSKSTNSLVSRLIDCWNCSARERPDYSYCSSSASAVAAGCCCSATADCSAGCHAIVSSSQGLAAAEIVHCRLAAAGITVAAESSASAAETAKGTAVVGRSSVAARSADRTDSKRTVVAVGSVVVAVGCCCTGSGDGIDCLGWCAVGSAADSSESSVADSTGRIANSVAGESDCSAPAVADWTETAVLANSCSSYSVAHDCSAAMVVADSRLLVAVERIENCCCSVAAASVAAVHLAVDSKTGSSAAANC